MKCRMCRLGFWPVNLRQGWTARRRWEPEMPELQILPFFKMPCLEEEEEKAAAERGEGQGFAIDSCRVFCGNGLAEI